MGDIPLQPEQPEYTLPFRYLCLLILFSNVGETLGIWPQRSC